MLGALATGKGHVEENQGCLLRLQIDPCDDLAPAATCVSMPLHSLAQLDP